MSKYILAIAIAAGAGVAYMKLGPPSERARVQRFVKELSGQLPRAMGPMVTMTRIELEDKTLKSWYAVDATFETDAATTAAVRQALLKQACADSKFRDILARGYAFDNFVDVNTPHGPGQFHILVASGDCV